MATPKRTLARLEEINRRQLPPKFGAQYQAAIRATPGEAPSRARCTIISSPYWNHREIHLLSHQELKACVLALYNPDVFDLHEQKILYPYAQPHPLAGLEPCPAALPNFKGTVDVCARLGIQLKHPVIFMEAERRYVPFPFIGDLLLFLDPKRPRLVNWSIKVSQHDFIRNPFRPFRKTRDMLGPAELDERHIIEITYYQDIGVETQLISGDAVPEELWHNLRDLFDSLKYPIPVSDEERVVAAEIFRKGVRDRTPGWRVLDQVRNLFSLTIQQTSALFRQEVWHRRVRLELYQPIDNTRPLLPETRDPLEEFSSWFGGPVK